MQEFSPLRARKFEKLHCKGMIFHGNSLHCKGPILEAKFWAERVWSFSDRVSPLIEMLGITEDANRVQTSFSFVLIDFGNFVFSCELSIKTLHFNNPIDG